jgi:peptidoglycan/LPS O-acetylase OafA/YrhL
MIKVPFHQVGKLSTPPKYRSDIDGLRAIAILSVIAFHAFPSWFKGGFVGVDIFFVISGYLISSIIFTSLKQTASFSFKEFYARRIKRIFPALILVMATCYIFGWFTLLTDEYMQLGKHIAGGSGFVSNFVLWNEAGYFDKAAELKPLQHLWSLGIEEQFYIVWPLLLYFAWKYRFNLLILALVIAGISFGANVAKINHDSIGVFYAPTTRFWELMIGSLLAYLTLYKFDGLIIFNNTRATFQNILAFVGILFVTIAVFGLNKDLLFPGWWALLPTFGTFLLISAGPQTWINRNVLSHRVMVWFGLISFPLYLWHWPLLSFAQIIESGNATQIMRIISVLASIALAWITYHFLEKPMRFGKYSTAKVVVLCVLMGILGYVGFDTFKYNGLQFRSSIKKVVTQEAAFAWNNDRLFDVTCRKTFPFEWGIYHFCLLTKAENAPTVSIIGDSHANHLYWGLSNFYKTKNENLLLRAGSGCFPFYDTESGMSDGKDRCRDLINGAIDYALNTASIKTIILTSYSNSETILAPSLLSKPKGVHQYIKFSGDPANDNYKEIYRHAMIATLDRLVQSNKKIIFIIDVPNLGFDPHACVDVRPWRITNRLKSPCAISKKEYEQHNAAYLSVIKSVLKFYPSVKIFDPTKYLCDKKYCWGARDGKILYSDSNHLSYAGSMYIGEKFALEFST